MAEDKTEDRPQETTEQSQEESAERSSKQSQESGASGGSILVWAVLGMIVVGSAAAGFGAAKLFAVPSEPEEPVSPAVVEQKEQMDALLAAEKNGAGVGWSMDLEPVIANLNEPGVTRYVRATLTLDISGKADRKKAEEYIRQRLPMLRNWLTIYLAGLCLDDVKGSRNLKRVQSEILDSFNEQLFPDSKPLVERVLFKEFAIQ